MKDTYYTINDVYEATFKDKGSKFIAIAHPIKSVEQAKLLVEQFRKDAQYRGACHFCFAYKLGIDNIIYRSSDDGEPSGTAGKPILNQIESFKLSDIIVVVIRFFGGTLLGTSGLINAYKQATIDCLTQVKIVEVIVRSNISITFSYQIQSEIERMLKNYNIEYEEKNFDIQINYRIKIKSSEFNSLIETINNSVILNQIKIYEY